MLVNKRFNGLFLRLIVIIHIHVFRYRLCSYNNKWMPRKRGINMERLNTNGIEIGYEDLGEGEVLVLLHGYCGSSAYWTKVQPILSQHYRCIVPDLRGHGTSDAPMGPYTIEQMADDVAELMETLNIDRYTVLGHSLGGYITLSLVERYPTKLQGAGIIHSTAFPDSEEAKEKRLKAVSTIQTEGITKFIDGLVPGLFAPVHVDTLVSEVLLVKEIGYRTPPQGAAAVALAMRERKDQRDVLSTTKLPVLLVAGECDQVIPVEKTFTAEGSNVMKAVIPKAGHMSMLEAPEQLAGIITDFVREHDSARQ